MSVLQQYLPFTVLKPSPSFNRPLSKNSRVATVLTVYGIETSLMALLKLKYKVATVLTVYGIETSEI